MFLILLVRIVITKNAMWLSRRVLQSPIEVMDAHAMYYGSALIKSVFDKGSFRKFWVEALQAPSHPKQLQHQQTSCTCLSTAGGSSQMVSTCGGLLSIS
jgi:hypothetical protein